MKKLLLGLLLVSCTTKKYNGPTSMHDAIWFTDTISFDGDTLYYFNSDSSEVRIYPPFILKENF